MKKASTKASNQQSAPLYFERIDEGYPLAPDIVKNEVRWGLHYEPALQRVVFPDRGSNYLASALKSWTEQYNLETRISKAEEFIQNVLARYSNSTLPNAAQIREIANNILPDIPILRSNLEKNDTHNAALYAWVVSAQVVVLEASLREHQIERAKKQDTRNATNQKRKDRLAHENEWEDRARAIWAKDENLSIPAVAARILHDLGRGKPDSQSIALHLRKVFPDKKRANPAT